MVREYNKGAFIIDQFKYVNEQGEKQPNPNKIINRELFLDNKTNKLDNNENELETEKKYVKEDNFSNLNEQISSLKNADEKDKDSHHLMGYINVDNLNFRSSPDFSNNIIKKLKYGTSLKVIEIIKSEILEVSSDCLLKNNFEIKHNQNTIVLKKNTKLVIVDGCQNTLTCAVEINDEVILFSINEELVEPITQEKWLKIIVVDELGYVYEKLVTIE